MVFFLFSFNVYDNLNISILLRSPKDEELLGLEWDVIRQVINIIFPRENSGVR